MQYWVQRASTDPASQHCPLRQESRVCIFMAAMATYKTQCLISRNTHHGWDAECGDPPWGHVQGSCVDAWVICTCTAFGTNTGPILGLTCTTACNYYWQNQVLLFNSVYACWDTWCSSPEGVQGMSELWTRQTQGHDCHAFHVQLQVLWICPLLPSSLDCELLENKNYNSVSLHSSWEHLVDTEQIFVDLCCYCCRWAECWEIIMHQYYHCHYSWLQTQFSFHTISPCILFQRKKESSSSISLICECHSQPRVILKMTADSR